MRHHHVGDDDVDVVGVLLGEREGGGAIDRFDHTISQQGEDTACDLTDRGLVLDQEDRLASHRSTAGVLGRLAVALPRWEPDGDARPGVRRAVDLDGAAVAGHDAVADGEAQPGAAVHFLGREEGLEEAGAYLAVHSHTRVAHFERDVVTGGERHVADGAQGRERDVAQPQGGRPTSRHGIARVEHQVEDELLHLRWIGAHRRNLARVVDRYLHALPNRLLQGTGQRRQKHVELHGDGLRVLAPGEGEQLAGDVGDPSARLPDLIQVGLQLGIPLGAVLRQLGEAQDARDGVVDLVRHAAREPADALQLLRGDEALLQELALLELAGEVGGARLHACLERCALGLELLRSLDHQRGEHLLAALHRPQAQPQRQRRPGDGECEHDGVEPGVLPRPERHLEREAGDDGVPVAVLPRHPRLEPVLPAAQRPKR